MWVSQSANFLGVMGLFMPLFVFEHTCMCEKEWKKSFGRVMLTVGWPWGSQSSSCRWKKWLSASLPAHDGSFIIIRHIVKRCCAGPQDGAQCVLLCMAVSVSGAESDRQQDRSGRGSLIFYDKCFMSEHMCLSVSVCHRCTRLRIGLCSECLSVFWQPTCRLSACICLWAAPFCLLSMPPT